MDKLYRFEAEDIRKIDVDEYAQDEFVVAKLGFLSTRPNSHELNFSEDCLRKFAPTALGKFVIADMTQKIDATTHTENQTIQGYIPNNQEIEFSLDDDGYLRAYVDAVISKHYAKDFVHMFEFENHRSVSVEMQVDMEDEDADTGDVRAFNICGVTVLGMNVRPSCPESDIVFTRFSEKDAGNFYSQIHSGISALKKFSDDRKEFMAESKNYKINKSKDAMSNKAWGDVDKTELRDKVVSANNAPTIVKSVYLLVEADWKDRPSEALKYPVMELDGDTFVYNRNGLSSALAYAKQEGETSVVNKLKKIYKSLDLEFEGKEETKMADEMKEEKKLADNSDCVEEEKDDDADNDEKETTDFEAKCSELMSDIEEKNNIIMERDREIEDMKAELCDLRKFKEAIELERKTASVNSFLSDVKNYFSDEKLEEFKKEGMASDNIDAWKNSIKAFAFDIKKDKKEKDSDVFVFAAPKQQKGENSNNKNVWDRI